MATFSTQCLQGIALTIALSLLPSSLLAETVAGKRIPVEEGFTTSRVGRQISGIACGGLPGTHKWCLAVNDERRYGQFFSYDGKKIVVGQMIGLLPERQGKLEFDEIDAEGAAYDDGYLYVVGSHGLSRNSSELRPSQFFLFRMPVDKATGKPTFHFGPELVTKFVERTAKLRAVIARAPIVAPYAEKPLDANGVNIEGLAARAGRLYFGLRGPSIAGKAYVIEVGASELFSKVTPRPIVHTLPLGRNTGIRAMTKVRDGMLLISGPVNNQKIPFSVHFWAPGKGAPVKLAELTQDHKGLAESLFLSGERRDGNRTIYSIIVMYDGMFNGRPTAFEIVRNHLPDKSGSGSQAKVSEDKR